VEPPAQVDHSSVAYKVFLCTNKERVANGVAPLVWDNALAAVAKGHSLDMKKRKYFAHTSPDGKTFIDRMEAAGLKIGAAGENIASAGSAESVVARWMASPGHRKNILKPQYKALGVGTGGPFVQLFNSRIIAPDSTITPSSNSMNSEEKQLVALYQETLGRAPDAAGLKFYSDKMKAGTSLETIRQSIYDSPEYQAKSTPTPSSPPTENQDPFVGIPGPSNPQTLAYQVYTLTNKERREYRNAFPLVWDSALAAVAQAHAKDMKARNFLSSKNPEGQNHQDRLRAAGIQWKYVTGENVAMGSTPAGVISQWMGSASHKSNIWNTHFRAVGVGVDGGYFVQLFSDKPNVTAPPIKKEAKQVFELVNKVRAEHGVAPFIWDDAVAAVAQSHATDMKVRNFTGHTNPDGLDQKERVIALVDCNKCKLLVGEMIGTGSSPEDVLATDFAATNFAGKPQICNNQYLKVGVGVEGDTYVLLYTHKREN
jgi:uncharacterized protein YkwD